MTASTQTVRTVDLPLGNGRGTLRIALTRAADGDPEQLTLVAGFGEGTGFNRPGWCSSPLCLPAEVLPDLRAALADLVAE